ncbi:MAG: 4-alpha-glucanotransferase [Lachnospiraceae bacterium]
MYRKPFGAAVTGSEVKLAVEAVCEADEKICSVSLRLWRDEVGEILVPMEKEEEAGPSGGELFKTGITMPSEGGLVWYFFIIQAEDKNGTRLYYYGNNHSNTGGVGCIYDYVPSSFQITVYKDTPVPKWFKEGIVYQIFPDRFSRDEKWRERCEKVIEENKDHRGQKKVLEEDWYRPAYYEKDSAGRVIAWPFYGGSLKGIEDKIPYLKSMGVSVIYLNPVFKANSNHRYDTADYMEIDPMLGSEEDFRDLARTAQENGISIMLDGVFSHTGADSVYFDKYGNYGGVGAYNNPDSKYRKWFDFSDPSPCGYRSWWGVDDLPEVDENNPDFIEMICGDNGVLAKWLGAGAKAFRLDVADELPDAFIRRIRSRLKAVDEDNLLLGEVWEDASNKESYGEKRKYFMGEELDSTMNYPLRDILLDFAAGRIPASQAGDRLMSLKENYPPENFYGAMNLIGSHDRERILTVMGADWDYDSAVRKVKLLSALQYALPGVPCVYYGDEAGMTGGADPDNRRGFVWGRENADMQNHFRQLGIIYDGHSALKSGDLKFFDSDDGILCFLRENDRERIIVAANRDGEALRIPKEVFEGMDIGYALDLLSSWEIPVKSGNFGDDLYMEPYSCRIILISKEAPERFVMERKAGVLCHISSIPQGKLGSPAMAFVDFIADSGMKIWQVLPVNPAGLGGSYYSSAAAFAGETDFINFDELPGLEGFEKFKAENAYWLEPYAAYCVLKDRNEGRPWYEWDEAEKNASPELIASLQEDECAGNVKLLQYYFSEQWKDLRSYANKKGIAVMGDLPVFVSADSADVWADKKVFLMNENGEQKCHAGVPPDYFCPEGQDWGNPLYDWDYLKETGYEWWIRRLRQCAERYDYLRLDHFRSFSEYFCIPQGKPPKFGNWMHGPGNDFFGEVKKALRPYGGIRILAEDLGQLDTGVYNLLKLTGYPGMNVWQFSEHDMRNMDAETIKTRVFYSGTHDNQTLLGWCADRCPDRAEAEKEAAGIIKTIYESGANWVIIQLQDMFMMGDEARMNIPGTCEGNWKWRIPGDDIYQAYEDAEAVSGYFRNLAAQCER